MPTVDPAFLAGRKALITGIANEQSIAWGCAKALSLLGAEVAITYLNEKAKPFVEPLAREINAAFLMPLDVRAKGQLEAVFERLASEWGHLDCLLHSIAFAPKEDLHGRVVDCSKSGFLTAMDVSCWSFIRMAHLAEPLMHDGGVMFTMTYYGSQRVVEHYTVMGPVKAALEASVRYLAAELGPKGIRVHAISPGPLKTRAASGIDDFDALVDKAQAKAPARSLVSIDDVGRAVAFLATDFAKLITGDTLYIDGGFHHGLSRAARRQTTFQRGNSGRAAHEDGEGDRLRKSALPPHARQRGDRMRRRTLLFAGPGSVIAAVARAQQSARPRVAYLSGRSLKTDGHLLAAFRDGLKEAGFVDGDNVTIEIRWAEGEYARLPQLAAELVAPRPDLIAAVGGDPVGVAAKAATSTIPIVFTAGMDPVELGLVSHFNHPAGNVTGMTLWAAPLEAKRMELLHQMVPKARSMALLLNPANPGAGAERNEAQQAAAALGFDLRIFDVPTEAGDRAGIPAIRGARHGGFRGRRRRVPHFASRKDPCPRRGEPPTGDLSQSRVRRGRRARELWDELGGDVPRRRRLCRPDPQGRAPR
jgi:enoyl-[acyl-carrier protein] reductase I